MLANKSSVKFLMPFPWRITILDVHFKEAFIMSIANKVRLLFKPVDLTKGKPWKVILVFWIPIVLSYIFQQLYTLIDELICGHFLMATYVTGIDDTNSLTYLVLQFAFGCSAGFSVVSSGKVGERDFDGLRKSFVTQLFLALVISIILTVGFIPSIDLLLNAVGLSNGGSLTEIQTFKASKIFLTTIYAGLFTQVFYNLICAFLRSMGDSLTPFLFLFGSTVFSVGLDFLFIAGIPQYLPDFGLENGGGIFGAGMSVNIAQFIAAVSCFLYALHKYPYLRPKKEDFHISFKFALEHLRLGLPLALQFAILAIGLIFVQSNVVSFDVFSKNYYEANGKPFTDNFGVTYSPILDKDGKESFNLAEIAFGPSNKYEIAIETNFDAFGAAMLSYCSQNRGARNYKRIKQGFNQGFIIALVASTILCSIVLLSTINGGYLHMFLSSDYVTPAVLHYGQMFFYFMAPCYIFSSLLFMSRSGVQGLGKPLFPFLAGIMEVPVRILVALYLPRAINPSPVWGNDPHYGWAYLSVALASPLAWITATLIGMGALFYYVYLGKLEKMDNQKFGLTGKII